MEMVQTNSKSNRMGTLGRLLRYMLKTSPVAFPVAMLCVVISATSTVAGSLFIQRLIDEFITPMVKQVSHGHAANYGPLLSAILSLGLLYLVGIIANYSFTLLMMVLAQKVQRNIRDDLFTQMESLPISYFDQNEYGDIMSRYTNDIDTLTQMIAQSIPQFVNSLISLIFVTGSMIFLSWQLTLFSMLVFALSIGVVRYLTTKSAEYFHLQQAKLGELNGYDEEMLSGLKTVKVFSHEKDAEAAFDEYNESLREVAGKANAYATVLFPFMGNMGNLLYVLIAIVGGTLSVAAVLPLSLGTIASFMQLSRSFSQPISQISQQLNSIVLAIAGGERIFAMLDQEVEQDAGQVDIVEDEVHKGRWYWTINQPDGSVKKVAVKGHIEFDHVNFGYLPDKQILFDINLEAKPGMKVALVGETGAGKTTISSMINRFYEISSGTITYDGIDIKDIKKSALRKSVSVVLQDTHMFTGSIMDNIRFGNYNASDDAVYQASRLAHADEFIHELDEGYDTVIDGSGSDLSQGQMQLLSIARAMIADVPVMILDEATSSIDTRTERMIQQGMDNLLKGRTSFVIAHRLSTIVNSDLILVLDHGHIIEAGNHEQLLAQKGYYYELYTGKREIE